MFQGDIIYALAGIRHVCLKHSAKAHIFLWLGRTTYIHEGWKHPLEGITLNEKTLQMLKPLLLSQPWIEKVEAWTDQFFMVDLDKGRHLLDANMNNIIGIPYGHIARWYFYTHADLACDLSQPWIELDHFDHLLLKDTIIVNRTERYLNENHLDYSILRKYGARVIFAGLPEEHTKFNLQYSLQLPILVVKDFYELALAIRACKVFVGNQSFCFALAEAMKVPRILEVWRHAPNVIPEGPNGYDFHFQAGLEYYLEQMA